MYNIASERLLGTLVLYIALVCTVVSLPVGPLHGNFVQVILVVPRLAWEYFDLACYLRVDLPEIDVCAFA